MSALIRFLRNLLTRVPQEVLIALLIIILLFLLILPIILLRLWECLLERLKYQDLYPEESEDPCGNLPEAIVRRPDPCIYSQRLLQSQGMPVTWNNPDIWVAPADNPQNIEPDSYHLIDDTDYVVSVRVHNASTDAAIGVRVRLNYRPWSFNSPDLVPVETDSSGNEAFRFVDVPPLPIVQSSPNPNDPNASWVAKFKWHTPKLEQGEERKHFCLQASLHHPLDTNTSNNIGQENTNVLQSPNQAAVQPGQEITVEVPLFNHARKAQQFRFIADTYQINPKDQFELDLTTTRGHAKWSRSQQLANLLPTANIKKRHLVHTESMEFGRFSFQTSPPLIAAKNKYVGYEKIKKTILSRDYSLPAGMTVAIANRPLDQGVEVPSKQTRTVPLTIKIPENANRGDQIPVNVLARSEDNVLAGGVTLIIPIGEGR